MNDEIQMWVDELRDSHIHDFTIKAHFVWDWEFFAVTPAFNLNFHSRQFELEWLFLGIYIGAE